MRVDLIRGLVISGGSRRRILLFCVLLACLVETACRREEDPTPDIKKPDYKNNVPATAQGAWASLLQFTTIGEVVGYNTVVVNSRADGPVVQINFREGQEVKRGELLAVIGTDAYRLALNEALAARDKDIAELTQDKATFARDKALYDEGIIAKQEFEKQEAIYHEMEGAVSVDQVAVDRATLELSYTRILAPIEGRVGFRKVDVGNIIHSSDPSGIVTITQIRPIAVVFSVPPLLINQILKSLRRHVVRVEAFGEDGKAFLGRGEVLTADTAIDSSTGAARIKAVFPNSEELLWPNEFVQIKLHLDPTVAPSGFRPNVVDPVPSVSRRLSSAWKSARHLGSSPNVERENERK